MQTNDVSSLHYALDHPQSTDLVPVLLSAGADINWCYQGSYSNLLLIELKWQKEARLSVVKQLIEAGVNVNYRSKETALQVALYKYGATSPVTQLIMVHS